MPPTSWFSRASQESSLCVSLQVRCWGGSEELCPLGPCGNSCPIPPVAGMSKALVLTQWCLLAPLLNVISGEALWKAAVTLLGQWHTLWSHSTFFSDMSTFEWATSEAIRGGHASRASGWPRAELRILVNGLQGLAY